MITYKERVLDNGLTILAHHDRSSAMAAVNVLYCVGARNENPQRTGFAHLFEHLMFRGTTLVPDFDMPVQSACGENNAFTTNDYTDYYITLPKDNVETALWLEADRMTGLDISPENLETEKRVVIEEFNQRYLNQPYGDMWMLLRGLAYTVHPYRWATIGLSPEHIADATIDDVRSFYRRFYTPSNAIVSVAANMEVDRTIDLVAKWFADLPSAECDKGVIPAEPVQEQARRMEVERDVPATMITIAFKKGDRRSRSFYLCDMISDILAGGTSARLYQELVKRQKLFSSVNAYITGDLDPGMFVVTGQLLDGVSVEHAERALLAQLDEIKVVPIGEHELEKVKNKFEAETTFGELNIMNKAMNLGFYKMIGDLELINREVAIFRSISPQQIMEEAERIFRPENSSTLIYRSNAK